MTSKGSRLVAVVLVALVVAAGLGYSLLAPKTPSQLVTLTTYTTERTSLSASSEQTRSTVSLSTTIASETTLWINVTATKPVSYYLGLLESNGTQPYVQLARELRRLPELTNATAVAKITYLALNATNPEVKEALELMMKGGTPDPKDFTYGVPNYNTELLALYQLAEDNELERDDTASLAVAMVSGLTWTMGNDQVRNQLRIDNNAMLNLAREIAGWQMTNDYIPLSYAPLEAKIVWAWRGSENVGYRLIHLRDKGIHIDEAVYSSMAVSVSTLREMRQFVMDEWLSRDTDETMRKMENLYIMLPRYWAGDAPKWTLGDERDRLILNANQVWEYFKKNGKGIGVCVDEATFVDALAKSVGIATLPIEGGGARRDNSKIEAHAFVLYYEPNKKLWKSYVDQVQVVSSAYKPPYWIDLYLPPVRQTVLLWSRDPPAGSPPMFAIAGYRPTIMSIGEVEFLIEGISTSKFRDEIVLPFYLDARSLIPSLWNTSAKQAMVAMTTWEGSASEMNECPFHGQLAWREGHG